MSKIIKVKDEHRTNPESLVPGGSTVETYTSNGVRLQYDKIKNPKAYIAKISRDPEIEKIYVDGVLTWERDSAI